MIGSASDYAMGLSAEKLSSGIAVSSGLRPPWNPTSLATSGGSNPEARKPRRRAG